MFLDYSLEHKGYHCYDPVVRRVFDESTPFYASPASTVSSTLSVSLSFIFSASPTEDSTSLATPYESTLVVFPSPASIEPTISLLLPLYLPIQYHYGRRVRDIVVVPLGVVSPVTPADDQADEVPTHTYFLRDLLWHHRTALL